MREREKNKGEKRGERKEGWKEGGEEGSREEKSLLDSGCCLFRTSIDS